MASTGMTTDTVVIRATLPVCLHLDSRAFCLSFRETLQITILTENYFTNYATYRGKAENAEVDSDTFSHFRFTRLEVHIPEISEHISDPANILETYKRPFFRAVNQFIDAARVILDRPGLRNYYDYSDFIEPVRAESTESGAGKLTFAVSFPGRGLVLSKPLRTPDEHALLQEELYRELTLPERFLADAKRDKYYNNYIYALLNAVIALEIIVSDAIREIGAKKQLSTGEIDKFISDVGLTGNIKTTLRLLCPDDLELPDEAIFSKCKPAVTIRNNVMHRGHRQVGDTEAEEAIHAIEAMIAFCDKVHMTDGG